MNNITIEQDRNSRWWVSYCGWGRPAGTFKDAVELVSVYWPDTEVSLVYFCENSGAQQSMHFQDHSSLGLQLAR